MNGPDVVVSMGVVGDVSMVVEGVVESMVVEGVVESMVVERVVSGATVPEHFRE